MFNLMVTGGDRLWEEGKYTWHKSRVFERPYTDTKLVEKFKSLSDRAQRSLMSFPVLFLYETGVKGLSKVGWIRKIEQRDDEVRVSFDFDQRVPPLPTVEKKLRLWSGS